MIPMIRIANSGGDIASTNYFETDAAAEGQFYLSWNASVARLLVPERQMHALTEMATGKLCIVSRGKFKGVDSIELLFDDGTDSPYAIQFGMQQTNRIIANDHKRFTVAAWSAAGKVREWPAKYRIVRTLPSLYI